MTRAEIIAKTLREMGPIAPTDEPCSDDPDEPAFIISVLREVLPADTDIRTCEDFGSLNVKCCDCCHGIHQHYEIALIDIETGGSAWICCAIDRALNPKRHANFPEHAENMTFNELLMGFIRRGEDAK